jgi:F-type H+-transporting ATPase subunit epsilon
MAQTQAQINEKIDFELVSPEEKLVAEPVKMAVIPGAAGEMGVGAGHSSFVVGLKAGVVKLYANGLNDEPRRIFIAGGFADVTAQSCIVLAEEAVNVNDLDATALQRQLADLTEDFNAADEAEKKRVQAKIEMTRAKLFAATGDSQYL